MLGQQNKGTNSTTAACNKLIGHNAASKLYVLHRQAAPNVHSVSSWIWLFVQRAYIIANFAIVWWCSDVAYKLIYYKFQEDSEESDSDGEDGPDGLYTVGDTADAADDGWGYVS